MSKVLDHSAEVVRGMVAMVAVVEHGSLARAAQALALTPSAMSKLVSRSEARLGAKLFERSTRRVMLTESGRAYLEHARRVLGDLELGEQTLRSRDASPRGTLRITGPAWLGHVRLLPLVFSYRRRYPDVQVQLDLSDRMVDLVEERIDAAIRITATPPENLVARKLDDDLRVLCASPAYFRGRALPKHPDDLAEHACLALMVGGRIVPWPLKEKAAARKARDYAVSGPLVLSGTLALHEATLRGFGIADLPRYLVADDLAKGRLVNVLPDHIASTRSVFVVYQASNATSPKLRSFVEHLKEGFQKPYLHAATK